MESERREDAAFARRIGLVGCVKKKANDIGPARNLYTSQLFIGRRSFVERSCSEWWILSAKHGLVHPRDLLAPYDQTLKAMLPNARRNWSREVLSAIDTRIRPTRGDVFEIHAGVEYRAFGLIAGLRERGCSIELPTEELGIGSQLKFYKRAGSEFE